MSAFYGWSVGNHIEEMAQENHPCAQAPLANIESITLKEDKHFGP
jgi:hypothetical protein